MPASLAAAAGARALFGLFGRVEPGDGGADGGLRRRCARLPGARRARHDSTRRDLGGALRKQWREGRAGEG
eukprot:1381639-Pleurochrysis_carterae.AAC.1